MTNYEEYIAALELEFANRPLSDLHREFLGRLSAFSRSRLDSKSSFAERRWLARASALLRHHGLLP